MGKIFFLLGKSSTGKDTIFKLLLNREELGLKTIVMYTTRPMRAGETQGVEYFFTTKEQSEKHELEGSIVEIRSYNTVEGIWKYYTRSDGQINFNENTDYLVIGTLEAFEKYCDYYGKERLVPIYIEIDDGTRLQRALDREREQKNPKYRELCRRFIADDDDYSEENIKKCGITKRFENYKLDKCIEEIVQYIKEYRNKVTN